MANLQPHQLQSQETRRSNGRRKEAEQKNTQLSFSFPSAVQETKSKAPSFLAILKACPDKVPLGVIAKAIPCSQQQLEKDLSPLIKNKIVGLEEDLCSLTSPPDSYKQTDTSDILPRALERLLDFIEFHRGEEVARRQVNNAITLAKECSSLWPDIVANVFRVLDKFLKRRGDKHLVLEVANLSIEAARRASSPRARKVSEGEAVALICGRSWVYQRTGRLPEAQVEAGRSLRLGQGIYWDRNTAYCKKCIGRLFRLQAEEQKGDQRVTLLSQSIASLQESIKLFEQIDEYGPTHPEIGDCYSLLARTYLVAGHLREADTAVKKAYQLIADERSKDYLDLVILSGDVQVAHGDRQAAVSFYDRALTSKDHDAPEISELRARAYMARGRNREAMNNSKGAWRDYEKAAEIYQRLGETLSSAEAKWEALRVDGKIPREATRLLENEPFPIRITVLDLNEKRSRMRSASAVAQRGAAGQSYWKQIIRKAHTQFASVEREW